VVPVDWRGGLVEFDRFKHCPLLRIIAPRFRGAAL
jgi:hypothetical protein